MMLAQVLVLSALLFALMLALLVLLLAQLLALSVLRLAQLLADALRWPRRGQVYQQSKQARQVDSCHVARRRAGWAAACGGCSWRWPLG